MATKGIRFAGLLVFAAIIKAGEAAAQEAPRTTGSMVVVQVPTLTQITVVDGQGPDGLPTLQVQTNDPAFRAQLQLSRTTGERPEDRRQPLPEGRVVTFTIAGQ